MFDRILQDLSSIEVLAKLYLHKKRRSSVFTEEVRELRQFSGDAANTIHRYAAYIGSCFPGMLLVWPRRPGTLSELLHRALLSTRAHQLPELIRSDV